VASAVAAGSPARRTEDSIPLVCRTIVHHVSLALTSLSKDPLILVIPQYTAETTSVQTFRAGNWVARVPLIWIVRATTKELDSIAGLMAGVVGPALDAKRMMVRRKAHRSIVLARMVRSQSSGQYPGGELTRYFLIIGYCKAGFCAARVDASPTPNAKRQLVQPGQVRQQLCAAGMVACPVQGKGYEVRNCAFLGYATLLLAETSSL
jgi:hypothetical protein